MLSKEQLLNPRRRTYPVTVQDFDQPLLLAEPSAALGVKLRGMRGGGVDFDSPEALQLIVADMVADENGRSVLTPEDALVLMERLSAGALTTIFTTFVELYARRAPAADAVPSKPSTSDS